MKTVRRCICRLWGTSLYFTKIKLNLNLKQLLKHVKIRKMTMITNCQTDIKEDKTKLISRYFGNLTNRKERYILICCQHMKVISDPLYLSQLEISKEAGSRVGLHFCGLATLKSPTSACDFVYNT